MSNPIEVSNSKDRITKHFDPFGEHQILCDNGAGGFIAVYSGQKGMSVYIQFSFIEAMFVSSCNLVNRFVNSAFQAFTATT